MIKYVSNVSNMIKYVSIFICREYVLVNIILVKYSKYVFCRESMIHGDPQCLSVFPTLHATMAAGAFAVVWRSIKFDVPQVEDLSSTNEHRIVSN